MEIDMRKTLVLAVALLIAACATGRVAQHAASVHVRAPAGYVLSAPQLVVRGGVLSVQGALCAGAAPTTAPPHEVVLVATSASGDFRKLSTPLRGGPLAGSQQRCAFYTQEVGAAEGIRDISVCAGKSCI
jgi:hypothetical protein